MGQDRGSSWSLDYQTRKKKKNQQLVTSFRYKSNCHNQLFLKELTFCSSKSPQCLTIGGYWSDENDGKERVTGEIIFLLMVEEKMKSGWWREEVEKRAKKIHKEWKWNRKCEKIRSEHFLHLLWNRKRKKRTFFLFVFTTPLKTEVIGRLMILPTFYSTY